jgi:hypothetical protein
MDGGWPPTIVQTPQETFLGRLGCHWDQLAITGSVLVVRAPRSLDRRDVTPGLIRSRSAAVRPPTALGLPCRL